MIGRHGNLAGKTVTKTGLWMLCMMEVGTFRTIHMMNEWWYDNSWGDSWGWYSYQEPLWNFQELSAGSGTKATLEQASASSSAAGTVQTSQSPLPPQGSVSAVTSQPSKTLTSRTPSAKNSPMANVALFAAVMMSAVSPSSSLLLDDMYSGVVDFRMPVSQFHFKNELVMSPVVTFMNKTVHEQRSGTLDQLGMELNTTW